MFHKLVIMERQLPVEEKVEKQTIITITTIRFINK